MSTTIVIRVIAGALAILVLGFIVMRRKKST